MLKFLPFLLLAASPTFGQSADYGQNAKTFVTYASTSWSNQTTYAINDMVTLGSGSNIVTYISLVPNNKNNNPANTIGTYWNIIGSAANNGGASAPATTSLYKGNGSLNGIVAANPNTDYVTPTITTLPNLLLPLSQTSGSLQHSQLPTLLSTDIPNNAANTTGNAGNVTATSNTTLTTLTNLALPGSQITGPSTATSSKAGIVTLSSTAATGGADPSGSALTVQNNAIPNMETYGTQASWNTANCIYGSFNCVVNFHSLTPDKFFLSRGSGGAANFGYLTAGSSGGSASGSGYYQEDYSNVNSNSITGDPFYFGAYNTRRYQGNLFPFTFNYNQTFGQDTHYEAGNRDNTGVFTIDSTIAGGQMGGVFNINSNTYGAGDNVIFNVNATGSGIASGDEEGDPELLRGYIGTNISRYNTTLTANPIADSTTLLYDLPVPANNNNNLGIGGFLLNTSNTYAANVSSIDTCGNPFGFICVAGSGDGSGNFTAKYGTSTMQAITIPYAGQITIATQPTNGDQIRLNGLIVTFVSGTPVTNQVAIGSTYAATSQNLYNFMVASTNAALTSATYSLLGNTISITSGSSFVLSYPGTSISRFIFSSAGTVHSMPINDVLNGPIQTVVNVANSAACTVGKPAVIVDGLNFGIGMVVSLPSSTQVGLATYGYYGIGSVLSCGGAAGYAIEINADDIPAGQIGTLFGAAGNNSYLRPRLHPIVGSDSNGNLIVWSATTQDYYTRGLYKTTVTAPTVALTITSGAVTSGSITESGNEYQNIPPSGASLNYANVGVLPVPTVTFSSGCTATATVSYYYSANKWYVGVPTTSGGGSPVINITNNGGTSCTGATASLTSTYTNPATIYPMGVLYGLPFTTNANGGTVIGTTPLLAGLVNVADWSSGASISNEILSHTKTKLAETFLIYNTADGGGNQLGGSASTFEFTGFPGGTSMWRFQNGDSLNLFAQPNVPVSTTQGFKIAPTGIEIVGAVAIDQKLPVPISLNQSVISPTPAVFQMSCGGLNIACANMVPYALFSLPRKSGATDTIAYDPNTGNIQFNTGMVTTPIDPTKNGYFDAVQQSSPGGSDVYPASPPSSGVRYTSQNSAPAYENTAGTVYPLLPVAQPPYLKVGANSYLPQDGMYLATKPVFTSWVQTGNCTSTTVTTNSSGNVTLANTNCNGFFAAPTQHTSIEVSGTCGSQTYGAAATCGVWLYDSTAGKIQTFEWQAAQLVGQVWTWTGSSSAAPAYSSGAAFSYMGAAFHLKATVSGTTLSTSYSLDGGQTFISMPAITVGTVTQMGLLDVGGSFVVNSLVVN